MTAVRPGMNGDSEQIPADLVDAFFDRELDEGARDRFFADLRQDLPRCAEIAKTQRIISLLREPVDAPDLTEPIMSELRRRRAFIPSRMRRMIKAGRLAAAACLLLGLLGIALLQRAAPDAMRLTSQPKPVGEVITSSASDARVEVQRLSNAMNIVAARVIEPVGAAEPSRPAPRPGQRMISLSLSPGTTSVRLPGERTGALVVYTGSGAERFVVPDAMYIDRSTVLVLPLGYISSSRAGMEWAAISSTNPFLLPNVAPRTEPDPAEVRVRVINP